MTDLRYEIDYKEVGQSVGWYTIDIRAASLFDAVCQLFKCCGNIQVIKISKAGD